MADPELCDRVAGWTSFARSTKGKSCFVAGEGGPHVSLACTTSLEETCRRMNCRRSRLLNSWIRRADIFISLLQVPLENWSVGIGEAQFAPADQ